MTSLNTAGGNNPYNAVIACKGICGACTCLATCAMMIIAICFAFSTSMITTYGYQTHLVSSYATELGDGLVAQAFPGAAWVSDGMGGETSADLVVPGAAMYKPGTSKTDDNEFAYAIWYPYIAITIGGFIYAIGLLLEWGIGRGNGSDNIVVKNYVANGNDIRWAYTSLTDVAIFAGLAAYVGAVNVYVISALAIFAFAWDILFFTSSFVNAKRNFKKPKDDDSESGGLTSFKRPRVWWFFGYGLIIAIPVFVAFFIYWCNLIATENLTTLVPTTFWLLPIIAGIWYLVFYVGVSVCCCELFSGRGAIIKEGCFIFSHGSFVWLVILWAGIEFAVNAAAVPVPP